MMLSVIDTELWLSAVVEIEDTVGAVVSIVKELIKRILLILPQVVPSLSIPRHQQYLQFLQQSQLLITSQ